MTVGERIKLYRKGAGFSQAELSKRSGVHRVMIGKYEINVQTPNQDTVKKIANALNIPVNLLSNAVLVRCNECVYYEGLSDCKIIGECGGSEFYCAYGRKSDRVKWDGMLYAELIKHHLCLFCEDCFSQIKEMDIERFAEYLEYKRKGSGCGIPNSAVPVDISAEADGITFSFPDKKIKIEVPWEMAAKYLKAWADESSLECSPTALSAGGYFYERLCVNGRNTAIKEKVNAKALEYGITQKDMIWIWDLWKCKISRLNKNMISEVLDGR